MLGKRWALILRLTREPGVDIIVSYICITPQTREEVNMARRTKKAPVEEPEEVEETDDLEDLEDLEDLADEVEEDLEDEEEADEDEAPKRKKKGKKKKPAKTTIGSAELADALGVS